MRVQLDFLREQLATERKQREGAVVRANSMRDSLDRAQKEVCSMVQMYPLRILLWLPGQVT